jgi:putative DNA primase/helicase
VSDNPTLASLANLQRWVTWRNELRGDPPKATKVPFNPRRPCSMAMANNSATWATREDAEAALPAVVKGMGGGIGFELGDLGDGRAIGGIDLDTCRDVDGTLEPWAINIIERFRSYAEISPSETGVKLLFTWDTAATDILQAAMGSTLGKAWKRGSGGGHPPSIELYLANRYFAITEARLPNLPAAIMPARTELLLELIRTVGPNFVGGSAKASVKGRSEKALAEGAALRRQGANYDQMVAGLLANADPDVARWAREKGTARDGREFGRIWEKLEAAKLPNGFDLTEDGIALAFTAQHEGTLRFDHHAGAWFLWTGQAWRKEETKLAFAWAREVCRKLARDAKVDDRLRTMVAKAATAAAVERFAQSDRAFAVTSEIWDRDPWLLGTPGGTVDLKTGELYPAEQSDHITKQTAIAAADRADCPQWLAFLAQATRDDQAVVGFLRRWFGYTLTGITREHALLFAFGTGGNGKGVCMHTVAGIMGDYAVNAAMDSFTASKGEKHPTDMAMLAGARMVLTTEVDEGQTWAEARLKSLTGGDPVTARFMRRDFFTFLPAFKLTVSGNHKPALRNVDEAARRRFNLAPFIHKPMTPDKLLSEKLKAEWPGILRWMIEGCLEWQRIGLQQPEAVKLATEEYFEAQDVIGKWMAERCIIHSTLEIKPGLLLADCRQWTATNGEEVPTPSQFRGAMGRVRGVRYVTVNGIGWVKGVGLNVPREGQGGDESE